MAELVARDARIAVRRARVAARLLAANSTQKDRKLPHSCPPPHVQHIQKDYDVQIGSSNNKKIQANLFHFWTSHCKSRMNRQGFSSIKSIVFATSPWRVLPSIHFSLKHLSTCMYVLLTTTSYVIYYPQKSALIDLHQHSSWQVFCPCLDPFVKLPTWLIILSSSRSFLQQHWYYFMLPSWKSVGWSHRINHFTSLPQIISFCDYGPTFNYRSLTNSEELIVLNHVPLTTFRQRYKDFGQLMTLLLPVWNEPADRKSRAEVDKDAGPGDKQLSKSLHSLADLKVWESFCLASMMRYIRSRRKISLQKTQVQNLQTVCCRCVCSLAAKKDLRPQKSLPHLSPVLWCLW